LHGAGLAAASERPAFGGGEGSLADTLKGRVAGALVWTTDQMEPGRGKRQVTTNDMYLGDIQRHLGRQMAEARPRYAFRAYFVEDEDLAGPEVVLQKPKHGLFVAFSEAFIVARDANWARTYVSAREIDGWRAEPILGTVKGKQAPGFRFGRPPLGPDSQVCVMHPEIHDGQASHARIREFVVGTFNGEEQAGPGQRDTPGIPKTAVVRLAAPTSQPFDVRTPPLDADARLVLAPGEEVLYQGRHPVSVMRNEVVAFGAAWQSMPVPASAAEVWVTTRRVAVVWKEWAGDESSGVLAERWRHAGFADEALRVTVAVAQLAYAWVESVLGGGESQQQPSLEFQAYDRFMLVRLRLLGFEPSQRQRLMREAARAIAAYRLASDATVPADARAVLEATAAGQPTVAELDWGQRIYLPSSYRIGRDPASLDAAATG
jgi:hypothetical protein